MADFWTGVGDFLGLNKGNATEDAAKKNMGIINALDTKGTGYLTEAKDLNTDVMNLGKQGATLYADAMGLNGAAGSANASGAFTTQPGYDFGLDQGLQAIQRLGSSQGRLQSGNTDIDLLQYGVKTANDEYGSWLDRLGGYNGMYERGTGAVTGSLGDLTDFAGTIAGGKTSANNMKAQGQEAGQGWGLDLLSNVAGIAGSAMGYGGF